MQGFDGLQEGVVSGGLVVVHVLDEKTHTGLANEVGGRGGVAVSGGGRGGNRWVVVNKGGGRGWLAGVVEGW